MMHRRIALAVVTVVGVSSGLVATGCDEATTEGGTTTEPGSAASVTERRGSGGGFSADLAKQIGGSGATEPGSAAGSATPAGSAAVAAGSAGSGSAVAAAGSGAVPVASGSATAPGAAGSAGSGSAAAPVAVGSGSAAKQSSAAIVVSAGSGSAAVVVSAGSGSASKAGSAAPVVVAAGSAPPPPDPNAARVPVKPSAEIAAIKLSLSPNWDRDVGEAGTISLAVKIPGRTDSKVFAWRYGYEDPKAPAERDAYKKWLADNKILTASLDRQRGAAWYLEGVDGSGAPAFRIIVSFGGRKLICGGLLYKDAASNQLGDIRDKTIIQAKEICETVAL